MCVFVCTRARARACVGLVSMVKRGKEGWNTATLIATRSFNTFKVYTPQGRWTIRHLIYNKPFNLQHM